METFLVIFREPDGRITVHPEDELKNHQADWQKWFEKWGKEGRLLGGSALTLEGRIITGRNAKVSNAIHQVGTEIVGGFLQIKAKDLDDAAVMMKTCPIYDSDGYAEIRAFKK
jgi:hypothetical protein